MFGKTLKMYRSDGVRVLDLRDAKYDEEGDVHRQKNHRHQAHAKYYCEYEASTTL